MYTLLRAANILNSEGGMHGLTSDLYKKQCNFQKEHILHPKAAALQDLVGKWLKTIGGSDKRVSTGKCNMSEHFRRELQMKYVKVR